MAFSRNSLVAAVAGTLSLAMLTGCPGPTQPTASPSTPAGGSAAPTTAPTAGGSAAPTTAPTAGASGAPTAAPSTMPSASNLAPTTVQGKVYDSTGALVTSGAKVNIKSLNPSNPFETNIDVVNGNYVANNVPAGVLVALTVTKDGYTQRAKVTTLLPLQTASNGNVVDFGGGQDPYFISKFPEVFSTEPVHNTAIADASKLVYKLTLSEPLNADNQRRFARALRVFPVNTQAIATGGTSGGTIGGNTQSFGAPNTGGFGGGSTTGAETATDTTGVPYTIQEGSTFLTTDIIASVTWDAAGQVATLTFNAPLKTDKDNKATYAVGLVQTGEKIADAGGDQLGLIGGAFNGSPASNGTTLLEDVFKKPELPALSAGASTEAQRWAETHNNVSTFDVPTDTTSPTFASLSVTGGNILTLTFSEPMVAYGGSSTGQVFIQNGVTDPANYVLRVAEKVEDLADQKLDTSASNLTNWASATTGTNFTLDPAGFRIEVSTSDPKVVRLLPLDLTAANAKFPVTIKAVKVRVTTNVKDPAGNAVSTSGDSNLKTSAI